MKIKNERPPNFDKIVAVLPGASGPTILFTYGDTIYNPSGADIAEPILRHEEVHEVQQGTDPEAWWDYYLANKEFRFQQELEAHRMEYRTYSLSNNREFRMRYLHHCAERLSSPLYGKLLRTSECKKLIKAK